MGERMSRFSFRCHGWEGGTINTTPIGDRFYRTHDFETRYLFYQVCGCILIFPEGAGAVLMFFPREFGGIIVTIPPLLPHPLSLGWFKGRLMDGIFCTNIVPRVMLADMRADVVALAIVGETIIELRSILIGLLHERRAWSPPRFHRHPALVVFRRVSPRPLV